MHIASMLGNRFSVIDLSELHNMYYYNLVFSTASQSAALLFVTSIFLFRGLASARSDRSARRKPRR
jgi:hypothetical protein